ncbi:MAG TPA: hypothetical protein VGK89_00550 [Candidatus Eisenbacteria bacterium]
MRRLTRFAAPLSLLLVLSCASTSELVRRGESALNAGNMDRAYDWSKRALKQDSGNARAREIMTAAAGPLLAQKKARVRNLGDVDTVAAARAAIEVDDFRAELIRYRVALVPDPEFDSVEARIRTGAARIYYDTGTAHLAGRRPKLAVADFTEAQRFSSGYRDVGDKLARAREEAISRVVILPFNNDVGVPGLALQLSADLYPQMEYQLSSRDFQYTRLVPREQIERRLTVAQAKGMSREEAVSLGRALGAQRVVMGRIHDLRSDTDTHTWHENLFHKVLVRGEDRTPRVNFEEERFEAVARERRVSIAIDLEVLETDEGERLAHDSQARALEAHTVFTHFSPAGSCDDYCVAPPEWKDSDRGQRVEKDWRSTFGSWTMPALLERARRDPGRTRYEVRYRSEFSASGTSTPVWLDDLPPVEDLAYIALSDSWMPILDMLHELDGKDDVDVLAGPDGH